MKYHPIFFLIIYFPIIAAVSTNAQRIDRPKYNTSKGFFVVEGILYDANGIEFVPRGINSGHCWFDHSGANYIALKSIDNKSGFDFNLNRIVWGYKKWSGGPPTDDSVLVRIIEKCIEYHMVPLVELHDFTGGTNKQDIIRAAQFYIDRIDIFKRFEKYVIINIANEWGNHQTPNVYWKDAYETAINMIREAGIKNTLWIDGPDWAKRISAIKTYGQYLIDVDPEKNIVFSQHYYCGPGESSATIRAELGWAKENKISLHVGEFCYKHDNYQGGYCDVKEKTIIEVCEENNQGYIWWAWYSEYFSIVQGSNTEADRYSQLSQAGKWLIFDDKNGIKNTSKRATIFPDTVRVKSIDIQGVPEWILEKDKPHRIDAVVKPYHAHNKTIKWFSTNSEVVEVDSNGIIIPRQNGTAEISATTHEGNFSDKITISLNNLTAIANNQEIEPRFYLEQNYPNPFNSTTNINYFLGSDTFVNLSIYDNLGQHILDLVSGYESSGKHTVRWNGNNKFGQDLSSGIYLVRMKSAHFHNTIKILLNK